MLEKAVLSESFSKNRIGWSLLSPFLTIYNEVLHMFKSMKSLKAFKKVTKKKIDLFVDLSPEDQKITTDFMNDKFQISDRNRYLIYRLTAEVQNLKSLLIIEFKVQG